MSSLILAALIVLGLPEVALDLLGLFLGIDLTSASIVSLARLAKEECWLSRPGWGPVALLSFAT